MRRRASSHAERAAITTHLHLDVEVDFAGQRLAGAVDFTVKVRSADAREFVLDTKHLSIDGVFRQDGACREHARTSA